MEDVAGGGAVGGEVGGGDVVLEMVELEGEVDGVSLLDEGVGEGECGVGEVFLGGGGEVVGVGVVDVDVFLDVEGVLEGVGCGAGGVDAGVEVFVEGEGDNGESAGGGECVGFGEGDGVLGAIVLDIKGS